MLRFRLCEEQDVQTCSDLEAASYPADEAASKKKIMARCKSAQAFFRVCERVDLKDNEVLLL